MGAAASKSAANQAKTATLKNALEKYIAATKNLKSKANINKALNTISNGKSYRNLIAQGVANAVVASRNGLIPESTAAVVVNNAAAKLNNLNKFPETRNAFTPNNNPNGSNKTVKITRNTANSNWKFVNSANNSKYSINQTNKNKPVIKFKNTSTNVGNGNASGNNKNKQAKAKAIANAVWLKSKKYTGLHGGGILPSLGQNYASTIKNAIANYSGVNYNSLNRALMNRPNINSNNENGNRKKKAREVFKLMYP